MMSTIIVKPASSPPPNTQTPSQLVNYELSQDPNEPGYTPKIEIRDGRVSCDGIQLLCSRGRKGRRGDNIDNLELKWICPFASCKLEITTQSNKFIGIRAKHHHVLNLPVEIDTSIPTKVTYRPNMNKRPRGIDPKEYKNLTEEERADLIMKKAKNLEASSKYNKVHPKMALTHQAPVLNDHEYFLSMAKLTSFRSKDPNTQVGACIVKDGRIVGLGYNGSPDRIGDDDLPWSRDGPELNTKYPYVAHAETNAIMNRYEDDLEGASIYIDLFPCSTCAKLIIQSGIKTVIYERNMYNHLPNFKASEALFRMANIVVKKLKMDMDIIIRLEEKDVEEGGTRCSGEDLIFPIIEPQKTPSAIIIKDDTVI